MTIKVENKYGGVELEIIEAFRPVSEIRCANYPDDIKLSLRQMEEITLIAGGDYRLQPVVEYPIEDPGKYMIFFHNTLDTAAACKLLKLNYTWNRSAMDEIARKLNVTELF